MYLFAALYGALFPNEAEAAFSNYRLWESIGFIVAFAWASFICIRIKLWVVLGILILGIIGYLTVLFLSKSTERNALQITPQEGPEKNKDSEQTIM